MRYFLTILLGLVFISAQAQNRYTQIEGNVTDAESNPLPVATVVILQAADSVMYGFTTSEKDGTFKISKIESGKYIVRISFVGYANYAKVFDIDTSKETFSLGTISMQEQDKILDGVDVVADAIPILIKGDTIEYNAASFKTQPNSTVEELLKKLPGVQVSREGDITAQGEQVNKILVDGKEFFGDDPKIATKNLPADAIGKVQVFDKQSEMSEFTGVDDGQRNKTINLKLKDDKKDGYFGRFTAGYGSSDRYKGKLNINKFTDKSQFSVIGSANNINEQSFSVGEYINMMGGMGGGSSIRISSGSLGATGNGITDTGSAGINLNYDLNKDTEIRSSYFFNRMDNDLTNLTFRQNFLDGSTFNTTENLIRNTLNTNHRLNLRVDHKFSEKADLIIKGNFNYSQNSGIENSDSETVNMNGQTENSGINAQSTDGSNVKVNSSIMYRKKFEKAGRSMVADFNLNNTGIFGDLSLNSVNDFKLYDPINGYTQILNQFQDQSNVQTDWGGKLSFTEPLGKKQYMEFSLTRKNYNTDYDKLFYDVVGETKTLNQALTNVYNRDYYYNLFGATYTINQSKSNFNLGMNYQNSELKGIVNENSNAPIIKEFNSPLPWMSYRYNFTTSKNLNFRYSTNLNEPSLEQLQPFVDNSDPINIYVGNPDLKAEYSQRLSLSLHSFDAFSNISLFGNIRASYTNNKITNSRTIDSFFRQTTTPVNVDYEKSIGGYVSFGAPLKFIKSRFDIMYNANFSQSLLYINSVINEVNRSSNMMRFALENDKKEQLDWQVGTRLSFNNNVYSESVDLNQNYLNSTYFVDLKLFLGKWTISQVFDYNIYGGEAFGTETSFPLWSAYISRTFMEGDRGELKLYAFDLLNQYQGISRNSSLNYIEETVYNALSRYVMLSFTYRLSKFAGGMGGDRIEFIERHR